MKATQRGFGVVEVILLVMVVGLIGLVTWQIISAQQSSDNSNTNETVQDSTEQAIDQNEGFVVVEEWGVRFKPANESLKLVYYANASNNQDEIERIDFTTSEIEAYGGYCEHSSDLFMPPALLARSKTRQGEPWSDPVAVIGDYYYYAIGGQSSCSKDSNVQLQQLEINASRELLESLATIEVAR